MREYINLLRQYPDYRNLWFARVVSNLGDWFNLLASAQLIASLTHSGTAVSLLFLARYLPLFFATPYAGVLADKLNRRNILIAADVLRGLTVLCFLLVREPEQIWLFYLLTALQFALSALYNPAHAALLAHTVSPKDLVAANTLDSATWSTMLALGALLGGLATAAFGVQIAFVIDAMSFVLAASMLLRISAAAGMRNRHEQGDLVAVAPDNAPPVDVVASAQQSEGMWASFVSGLRYLRLRPVLLGVALVKGGGSLVYGAVNVLEISLANNRFPINGTGTLTLGIIYALIGIGTGVGPILFRRVAGDAHSTLLRAIGIGFACMTLGVLGMALAGGLAGALGGVTLRAFGVGICWVFSESLLLSWVEDAYRGRVLAFQWAVFTATEVVSTIFAGFAVDALGLNVQQALLAMGLLGIVVTAAWWLFEAQVRRRKAMPIAATA